MRPSNELITEFTALTAWLTNELIAWTAWLTKELIELTAWLTNELIAWTAWLRNELIAWTAWLRNAMIELTAWLSQLTKPLMTDESDGKCNGWAGAADDGPNPGTDTSEAFAASAAV